MTTHLKIAEWMKKQMDNNNYLYQDDIVWKILSKFGNNFVYINMNGNYAIDKKVLKLFRKLTEDDIVWERGIRAWRWRKSYDTIGKRQAD